MRTRILAILIGAFIFGALPSVAEAASLFLSPNSGSYGLGQTLSVQVRVNTSNQAINAAEGTLTFPTASLDFSSVSKSGSIFTLWASEPSGSDSTGRVTFSGGLPSPGYNGTSGLVVTVNFRVISTGSATVQLTGSKILANDGQGTNILTGQGSGSYTLTQAPAAAPAPEQARTIPTLTSTTHPDQSAWYTDLPISIAFSKPSGLQGISYVFDDQPTTGPDVVPDTVGETLEFTAPNEGIWYVHVRGWYSSGWSEPAHYRVQIDRTAPEVFAIELERDRSDDDATPTVVFATTDVLSGVARYTISVNGGEEREESSPATLALTKGGTQRVVVRAYDQADNVQTSELEFSFTGYPPPIITSVTRNVILLQEIEIRGTASTGDEIIIFFDGEEIGSVTAGQVIESGDIVVRVPWVFTFTRLLAPGTYEMTAIARSPNGLESVPTDPIIITIRGSSIVIGGQQLLTVALAPTVAAVLILLLLGNTIVLGRLFLVVRSMHKRELQADRDIQLLERRLRREKLSTNEIEESLEEIEDDLHGKIKKTKPPKRS